MLQNGGKMSEVKMISPGGEECALAGEAGGTERRPDLEIQ